MTEQALRTEIASLKAHVAGLENQLTEDCKHEWRIQMEDNGERIYVNGYFCVHCLERRD